MGEGSESSLMDTVGVHDDDCAKLIQTMVFLGDKALIIGSLFSHGRSPSFTLVPCLAEQFKANVLFAMK